MSKKNNAIVNKLNKKIEVWGKIKAKNRIGEVDYEDGKIKTIWAAIIPQTANMQRGQVETILSNTTHKIIIRYGAGKDIKQDMVLKYQGHRFDINYILNPYFKNETLEIFCSEKIE